MPHAIRLRHRDRRDPLGTEPVDDRAVDLQPARGLHVDVDVGQHDPLLRQEPLHQQPVLDRIGVRDPEQMVDERPRTGAPGGDPDAHLPHIVDHLGHGQKVGGEAVVGDDVQLVVHPLPVLPPPVVPAQHHPRRRPRGQRPLGAAAAGADQTRLGKVDGTDPEVVLGIDQALGGRDLGLLHQSVSGVPPEPRGLHDPLRHPEHGPSALEPGLAGVQLLGRVDRHQPARGVQHVGDRAEPRVGVPYGVAEHGPDPLLGGEPDGPGGQPQGAGTRTFPAMPDGLQPQGVAVDLPPGHEQPRRTVGTPGGQGTPHIRVGPEQYGHALGVMAPPGQQGCPLLLMHHRDEPAQPGPPTGAVPGEKGHPGGRLVDEGATAHRSPAPPPPRHGLRGLCSRHRQLRPEHRTDSRFRTGLREPDGAGKRVAIGESQGVHAPLGGTLGQPLRVRGSISQREPGDGVQMREPRHTHLPHS